MEEIGTTSTVLSNKNTTEQEEALYGQQNDKKIPVEYLSGFDVLTKEDTSYYKSSGQIRRKRIYIVP